MRVSKAETRMLEQYRKLETGGVRGILDSLSEDERVAYTTVPSLVDRLEQESALRRVAKIGNSQLVGSAVVRNGFLRGLVRDLLELCGGPPRLLDSNLLEAGTSTVRNRKALPKLTPGGRSSRSRGGNGRD